jgi:hypothetical protein
MKSKSSSGRGARSPDLVEVKGIDSERKPDNIRSSVLNLSIRPALSRKIRLNLLVALPFFSVGASSPLASLDRGVTDPARVDEAVETPSSPEVELPPAPSRLRSPPLNALETPSPPELELPPAPSRLRSPPLNAVKSLPRGEDLLAQAVKGPDGRY